MSAGYFKDELRDSELWNELENKAAATYVEVRRTECVLFIRTNLLALTYTPSDATRRSFACQVDEALSRKDLPDHLEQEEDPDDWLNVDAQEFEQMLENTLKRPKASDQRGSNAMDIDDSNLASDEDPIASKQAKQLKDLASKVEGFIQGEGELEGALFEK